MIPQNTEDEARPATEERPLDPEGSPSDAEWAEASVALAPEVFEDEAWYDD